MQGAWIGRAPRVDIAEVERIARRSAMPQPKGWKIGLAAFIAVVEIDEKGHDPLAPRLNVGDKSGFVRIKVVVVKGERFSNVIM